LERNSQNAVSRQSHLTGQSSGPGSRKNPQTWYRPHAPRPSVWWARAVKASSLGSIFPPRPPPAARRCRLSAFGRSRSETGPSANPSSVLIATSALPRAKRGNATRTRLYFGGYVTRYAHSCMSIRHPWMLCIALYSGGAENEVFPGLQGRSMQEAAFEFPRIPLPRTPLNKGYVPRRMIRRLLTSEHGIMIPVARERR
jgi:hypothetical protein